MIGALSGLFNRFWQIASFALQRIGATPLIPLAEARRRCADLPGVFEHMFVPDRGQTAPLSSSCSSVVYYLSPTMSGPRPSHQFPARAVL
jgi:hypothetical protein